MESTYWCRWNGKSWEPFLLQPLKQSFVGSSDGEDSWSIPCVQQACDETWEQAVEKKGFQDGYLAGCLQGSSGGNNHLPSEQLFQAAPFIHTPPRKYEGGKTVQLMNKSQRSGKKTKSKRKMQDEQEEKTNHEDKPSSEGVQHNSSYQQDYEETEKVKQEIQELEATIDAQFVKVVRERNPPLWPILGLNLGYSES
ncbi:hypothetical protein GpartN1_g1738.t1 [Galdieria partita]|uniref:Uncharacterized protein n=1 Tax=Galdieria partita TaxID=83374 RepID=A0A9C7PU27_9RHOD|nr:hypothetical protein GpartN1_g1738.t1 [Galdieria partita]